VPTDDETIKQLRLAVEHRTDIGIALGILMERHDIDRDQAFAYLQRRSRNENRKLYDLALEIAART
jgi:AmiR/NasT family two-component response regulator